MFVLFQHFEQCPPDMPICVHAEGDTASKAILLSVFCHRAVHVCHVATKNEVMYNFSLYRIFICKYVMKCFLTSYEYNYVNNDQN